MLIVITGAIGMPMIIGIMGIIGIIGRLGSGRARLLGRPEMEHGRRNCRAMPRGVGLLRMLLGSGGYASLGEAAVTAAVAVAAQGSVAEGYCQAS
jgi:hypothetical protein